jgi:signal transduction histidine kinase
MQLHREVDQLASRLGKVVSAMPVGVLVLDMTGMVVASNPAANRLLKGRLDPGADILSIPDPVAGRELRRMAIDCLSSGEERGHESRLGRGREAVPVRLRAVPTRGTTDERPDALIIIEDLSLSREVEQLRQLDEMKSNFITLVSHELRTPITSIRGACSLVLNFYSSALDEAPLNLIRIMGANVERLSGVVNSILDISLLDQQRLELSLEPVDLSVLVEHVMTDHVGAIEDRQLTVEWLCPDDLPPVTADPQRLRQAIDSLVDNPIKFTDRKGRIFVEAEVENGILNFSVEDTGHGIPPEYRELVFHKFYQIEDPMTRRAGGAGVGLYIAREIAHLHRGHLHATDPVHGPGARLVLSIPM